MSTPARCLLVSIAAVALSLAASAQADDWRLDKEKDGIQVSSRAVPGWSIREIRGVTRLHTRLSALVAVIDDLAAEHEINDLVSEARVVARDSPLRYRIYSATTMPWPLSDRDIVSQRVIAQDAATHEVSIIDDAVADGLPLRQGFVRMTLSHQEWRFAPTATGEVQVTLQLRADPNGPIPSSIINMMSVDVPFKSLTKVKELAQRPSYAGAQLAFIQEP
jgi:hypothetical protein